MRLPEIPGGLFHITTRGNAKATIFHEDRDYEAWLRRLDTTVRDFGWRCHACCVMPNHFHLLVETPQPTRAAGMLVLNGSYARRYNARYTRVGHVFQTPYSAEHVDTDAYFMQASRYIALNPVRAGLRLDPGDWRWSSFRALAGLEPAPGDTLPPLIPVPAPANGNGHGDGTGVYVHEEPEGNDLEFLTASTVREETRPVMVFFFGGMGTFCIGN